LESLYHDSNEGDSGIGYMTLGTNEVENNQTVKPMVNLGKDKASMYGAPKFSMEGNKLVFPSGGRP